MTEPADVERMVEALLFASHEPMSAAALAARLPEGADVGRAIGDLRVRYAGRGVELECVADRWRFRTAPDLAFLMQEMRDETRRLSRISCIRKARSGAVRKRQRSATHSNSTPRPA